MPFTEHTSLLTSTTYDAVASGTTEANERLLLADLGTDIGAPFTLYIKHTGNVGTTGNLKYTDGTPDTAQNSTISADESKEIGNNIHRILKYYLGANYSVNQISQVRLNVVFRS